MRALRDLGRHALGQLEVACADRDVVDRHDPGQLVAREQRQPPDVVLDHQVGGVLEVHLDVTGDERLRGVVAGRALRIGAVGQARPAPGRGR